MYFNDAYCGSPLMTFGLGHVAQQGTAVNHIDVLLSQPSHVPTLSCTTPQINLAPFDYSSVGYGTVDNAPQGVARCDPPTQVAQSTGHTSSQHQLPLVSDVPTGHITGLPVSVGSVSRGSSARCQWQVSQAPFICGQTITAGTAPRHLAEHGICRMHKDLTVQCLWWGCEAYVKRHAITRHVREVHLGLKRKPHRHAFIRGDFCH